jgi:hypothetical protein
VDASPSLLTPPMSFTNWISGRGPLTRLSKDHQGIKSLSIALRRCCKRDCTARTVAPTPNNCPGGFHPDFALSIATTRADAVEIEVFTYQIGSVKNKENRGLIFVYKNKVYIKMMYIAAPEHNRLGSHFLIQQHNMNAVLKT